MEGPEFLDAVPVLPALDLGASISFYEQRLGFACAFRTEEYAGIKRGEVEIHLWRCADPAIAGHASCRINIRRIDALYEEYESEGVVHPEGPLATKPWGLREFTVVDSSGNTIVFAEPVQAA